MITQSFTLTAATPLVALTGSFVIRQIVYNGTAAGTLTAYDAETTSTTQSNPAYEYRSRNCEYTRTVTGVRDIACGSNDYEYEGVSDTETTVAADATAALQPQVSLGIPAAGQAADDMRLLVARGLMLVSTVNATVQVTYEVAR